MGFGRLQISEADIAHVVKIVESKVSARLDQKGRHALMSRHEALGVIMEEIHELEHAVQTGSRDDVSEELLDVAVAAILGLVSADAFDW